MCLNLIPAGLKRGVPRQSLLLLPCGADTHTHTDAGVISVAGAGLEVCLGLLGAQLAPGVMV